MDTRRGVPDQRDRTAVPVGTDTSSVEIVDLETVRNTGGRRGSGSIVLVIGVVVAAVLFGVVIASPRLDTTSATPPPTNAVSLVSSTPGASLAPTPRPSRPRATPQPTVPLPTEYSWAWRSVVVDAFISQVQILRMWSLEDRVVALTSTEAVGGDLVLGLMVSPDGENWARGLLPVPGFRISGGAVADGALWIIGATGAFAEPHYEMWSTTDASTWTTPGELEGLPAGPIDVIDLARGPGGWVVVVGQAPTEAPGPYALSIQVSPDGLHWSTAKKFATTNQKHSVGLATDGRSWVLVMERPFGANQAEVTALRSTDARSWTAFPIATLTGYVRDVTAGPGGFVVVGGEGVDTELPRGWLSAGGREWEPVSLSATPGRMPIGVGSVVTTETGYLAIGRFGGDAWLSPNGLDWESFPAWRNPDAGSLYGVTTLGDRIIGWGLGGEADMTIYIGSLGAMVR